MASFSISNFIAAHAGTDVAIRIKDINGNFRYGFNVGRIQKVATEDKILIIVIETSSGSQSFTLDFATIDEARSAQIALSDVLNTLFTNYKNLLSPVFVTSSTFTIIPLTLAAYITAAGTNSLSPLQTYSITDAGNTFGFGTSYQVTALTNNDTKPEGIVPSSKLRFRIDMIANKVLFTSDTVTFRRADGDSVITSDGASTYISAANKSIVNTTTSHYIDVKNNSQLIATDCSNVVVDLESNLTLANATNSRFYGITGDYSALTLDNIVVDQTSSLGKLDMQQTLTDASQTLQSYVDDIEVLLPTFTANRIKSLEHSFTEANAEFRVSVPASTMGPYTCQIEDLGSSTIIDTITSAQEGMVLTYKYDKNTGRFRPDRVENPQLKQLTLTVGSDGQTSYALSTKFIDSAKSNLYVNGIRVAYGIDYVISGTTLSWLNNEYILETTDSFLIQGY